MSEHLAKLVIVSGVDQLYKTSNYNIRAFVIGNESGLTVTITLNGGQVQKTLYPSMVDWFQVNDGFTGQIVISPETILNNVATFPASSIIIDGIWPSDPEEATNYPITLPRAVNALSNTSLSTANRLTADGDATGSTIIEVSELGSTGSNFKLLNSGDLTVAEYTSLVLTTILRTLSGQGIGLSNVLISDTNHQAEVLGTLKVDGTSEFVTPATFDLSFNVNNGQAAFFGNASIQISSNANPAIDLSSHTGAQSIKLKTNGITRISKFTGTATTTPTFFNHGLGDVPDIVICQFNSTSATAHDIAVDYPTITSTQVKLTADGTNAFVGLAIKF